MNADKPKDGRTLRSERSQQKIVDAIVELIEAGTLVPTAEQVARQAGVGIRTVFRHFNEMNELYVRLDERVKDDYEQWFAGGDREGNLDERISNLVNHFGRAFEKTTNLQMSVQAQFWRVESLQKNYEANVQKLRKNLMLWLPELRTMPNEMVDAVCVAVSFEAWYRLRVVQQRSIPAAHAAIEALLRGLLRN